MSLLIALQPSFGPALVVGGGAVARRKVSALIEAGFAVTVVAPETVEELANSRASVHQRPFNDSDLDDAAIVFACTNDRMLNKSIGERCRAAQVPVLVADSQSESTFFSPATTRRGPIQVGVTTGGAGPGLATTIRDSIDAILPDSLAADAEDLRRRRRRTTR
jgi:siroheme synthase-like protein